MISNIFLKSLIINVYSEIFKFIKVDCCVFRRNCGLKHSHLIDSYRQLGCQDFNSPFQCTLNNCFIPAILKFVNRAVSYQSAYLA